MLSPTRQWFLFLVQMCSGLTRSPSLSCGITSSKADDQQRKCTCTPFAST